MSPVLGFRIGELLKKVWRDRERPETSKNIGVFKLKNHEVKIGLI